MDARLADAQFASILLNEPAKAAVMDWRPGQVLPRQARLVAMTPATVFEVVADLTAGRVLSVVERKGVEPPVMASEFETAKVVLAHPEFRLGVQRCGRERRAGWRHRHRQHQRRRHQNDDGQHGRVRYAVRHARRAEPRCRQSRSLLHFNFRLDLDVDGPRNSFDRDTYRPVTLPVGSPRRSLYVVEPTIAATEKAAGLRTGHEPVKFRVMNEARRNAVGNDVSYEIAVANHARLLLDPDDWPANAPVFCSTICG